MNEDIVPVEEVKKEEPEEEKITKEGLKHGFGVLFRYFSLYKKQVVILSVFGIVSAVGHAFVPYFFGKFFDSILDDSVVSVLNLSVPFFAIILSAWIFLQLVTYFLDRIIRVRRELLSNNIWVEYLSKGFGFLIELPMSFHKKNKIGEIANKVNMAGNALETIIGRVIIDIAPQLLSILIALVITFYINPLLTAFLIVGVVLYIFILTRSVKPIGELYKDYWAKIDVAFGDAYDSINNTQAIKQATSEKYEQNKIIRKFEEAIPSWIKQIGVSAGITFYQQIVILLTQTVIFIVSIVYIKQGVMTIGELISFSAYASMMFGPLQTIGDNWRHIHSGIINIEKSEKILQTLPEVYVPKNPMDVEVTGKISFSDVSFSYDEGKEVLSNISFEVNSGDVVALVGESGVGKSTLVDLISGYHFSSTGEVLIDNVDIKNVDLRKFRSKIAVVPQEVVLFNDTIRTNIKYGNFHATDEEVLDATRKAHALSFIDKFTDKWEQVVGERGVKLSVGQKQRVAIARAILRDPRILILDEPTSALDAGSEKIITESFEELMRDRTTFIIAHRLATVRRANLILVFKEGKIIERGTHMELLKIDGGEYRRLYDLQIGLN